MTASLPTVEKLASGAPRPALASILAELSRNHCRDMTLHATKVASAVAMGRSMAHQDPEIMEKLGAGRLQEGIGLLRRGWRNLRGEVSPAVRGVLSAGDDAAQAVTPGLARTKPVAVPKTQVQAAAQPTGRVSGFEPTMAPGMSRAPASGVNVSGARPQPLPRPKPSPAGADVPLDPDVTPSMLAVARQPRAKGMTVPPDKKAKSVMAADPKRVKQEAVTVGGGSQAPAPPAARRLERAYAEGGEEALRRQAVENARRGVADLPGATAGGVARPPTKNPLRAEPLKPASEVAEQPMGLDFMRMVDAGIDPSRAEMLMQTSRRMSRPHMSASLNPTILKRSHDLRAYLQMMRAKTAGAGNPTAEGIGSVVKVGALGGGMIKGSNDAVRRKAAKANGHFTKQAIGALGIAGIGAGIAGLGAAGYGAYKLHGRHRRRQGQQYRAGVGTNRSHWKPQQM